VRNVGQTDRVLALQLAALVQGLESPSEAETGVDPAPRTDDAATTGRLAAATA
jgi:hypothetical protein